MLFRSLADYMLPRKAEITRKRTQGDKRTERIFDGTAIHAVELLASSLHGMLTSPSTPWFSMRYRNPALQGDDEANEWLELAIDQMYQAFNRSNFQQEIHELYYDLVTFGTAAIYVTGDKEGLQFSSRHIAEIYTLSLHDALPIFRQRGWQCRQRCARCAYRPECASGLSRLCAAAYSLPVLASGFPNCCAGFAIV